MTLPVEAPVILFTLLPGPDRKREARPYGYRVTYRNPDAEGVGCVMLWEVSGGRLHYQIALERDETGGLRLHCSCADAIYRGEAEEGHVCKHVRGLIDLGRRDADPVGAALGIGA